MKKILLVEDDVEISDMLKKFLGTEGFEVVAAYDGESACKLFFEKEYALVLLDLMIPKMDGMEVMNVIRAESMVPIIIVSAKDTDSDKSLGLGLGRMIMSRTFFRDGSISQNQGKYQKKHAVYVTEYGAGSP